MRCFMISVTLGIWLLVGCGSSASTSGASDAGSKADASTSDVQAGDALASDTLPGDTSGGDSQGDTASLPLKWQGPCELDRRVGRFEVLQDAEYGSSVSGNVADRIDALQVLVAKESQGACKLWQRKAAVCTPGCTGSQQCVRNAGCQPFPAPVDVGKVTITGLVKPVVMTAKGANKDYFFTDFDADPYAAGSEIALSVSGNPTVAFGLDGYGVTPLSVPNKSGTLQKGKAFSLDWQPAAKVAGVLVHLSLNVDQHGLTPVTLTCDVEDTGHLEVPVALTDALLGYGVSGAATAWLQRQTVDSMPVSAAWESGCVELIVGSKVALQVLAQ
ncbi:MAG: hypothetical protein HY902_10035 [Deltaproteobacteria bacterium]|nr:hypothetical protein [Deltaproteobacteria bacterium]